MAVAAVVGFCWWWYGGAVEGAIQVGLIGHVGIRDLEKRELRNDIDVGNLEGGFWYM